MAGGVGLVGCRPALRMLAIGCCAKLRLGGGLAVKDKRVINNMGYLWFTNEPTVHRLFWNKRQWSRCNSDARTGKRTPQL